MLTEVEQRQEMPEAEAWEELRRCFRTACQVHLSGLDAEACEILTHDLPRLMAQWSQLCPQTTNAKKRRLLELFHAESASVGIPNLLQQMFEGGGTQQNVTYTSNTTSSGLTGIIRQRSDSTFQQR